MPFMVRALRLTLDFLSSPASLVVDFPKMGGNPALSKLTSPGVYDITIKKPSSLKDTHVFNVPPE